MKHLYRIQQIAKDDCGPVSLKMLLAYVHQSSDYLFLVESWPRPMSLKQIIDQATHYGVFLKGYRLQHYSHLYKLNQPFIALMNQHHFHYVIVVPKPKGMLGLVDPQGSANQVTVQDFFKSFSGYLLRVQDIGKHTLATEEYFYSPAIPLFHYVILILLTLIAWVLMLAPMAQVVFIGLCVGWSSLTLLWMMLGWNHVKRTNTAFINRYHPKITSKHQYQQFFYIKNQVTTLPYRILYRQVLFVTLILYGAFAQWTFLPFAAIYWLSSVIPLRMWNNQRLQHIRALDDQEKKLVFPLLRPQPLKVIHDTIDRLTHHEIRRIVFAALLAFVVVLLYHTYFPLLQVSSWFVAWTMLMVGRQTLEMLLQYRQDKQALRQAIYQFMNTKQTMVK